jgi:hypothetical protein
MAMDKGKMSGGGKFMDNGKGMCAYKDNPMVAPNKTKKECGPGMNADQKHANKLIQEADKRHESLRGMSGM